MCENMRKITVCMGSSCFGHGNSVIARMVQDFITNNNLEDKVEVSGCLCEGECCEGPNIRIDGKLYSHVTPGRLNDLLKHELGM
jgi:NADH:ubiquinone oxidoreductase subunit E